MKLLAKFTPHIKLKKRLSLILFINLYLFIMKTNNHTTAKILLGLSFLGLIYLLNILLFLIEQI